ncbi:hypothetical protein CXG81DRAFT_23225 [Caulochytrium protostelioides]|uniref:Uncharacterized protein n=1 Tax=Caulochytrium protostelioides TaxID=1555241 RepID=A0A4P9XEW5_9FUNG|nr:hypothetical protein CXG81DRAFT_23225 [Caulochytrium protostelioides]|eukprot:RKP04116.1 hypothetical protein CXG81DRAFT_23225 [Caulochytrium protostelioides]
MAYRPLSSSLSRPDSPVSASEGEDDGPDRRAPRAAGTTNTDHAYALLKADTARLFAVDPPCQPRRSVASWHASSYARLPEPDTDGDADGDADTERPGTSVRSHCGDADRGGDDPPHRTPSLRSAPGNESDASSHGDDGVSSVRPSSAAATTRRSAARRPATALSASLLAQEQAYRKRNASLSKQADAAMAKVGDALKTSRGALAREVSRPVSAASQAKSAAQTDLMASEAALALPAARAAAAAAATAGAAGHPIAPSAEQRDDRGARSAGRVSENADFLEKTTERLLKAKIAVLEQNLETVMADQQLKATALVEARDRILALEGDNKKLTRDVAQLTVALDKTQAASGTAKETGQAAALQLQEARRELAAKSKQIKALESQLAAAETKLTRAAESVAQAKADARHHVQTVQGKMAHAQSETTAAHAEVKRLERQKHDLVVGFKKAVQLVEVLKRQKAHLEALKVLELSESEVLKVLQTTQ